MGWSALVMALIQKLPDILYRVDHLFTEPRKGGEKLPLAEADFLARELDIGVTSTEDIIVARRALISAGVAYANALEQNRAK